MATTYDLTLELQHTTGLRLGIWRNELVGSVLTPTVVLDVAPSGPLASVTFPPTEEETQTFNLFATSFPVVSPDLLEPAVGTIVVDNVNQSVTFTPHPRFTALPVQYGTRVASATDMTVTVGLDTPVGTTVGTLVSCFSATEASQPLQLLQNAVQQVEALDAVVRADAQLAADACAALNP